MELTLTKSDYKAFFIYNHFFGARALIKYLRLFCGPLLILLGIYLLKKVNDRFGIAYGGFALGFGIYYMLMPFVSTWFGKFKEETFTYQFTNDILDVHDRISNTTFDLIKYPIQKNSRYYFIKFENGSSLFFPKKKLSEEALKEFEDRTKGAA